MAIEVKQILFKKDKNVALVQSWEGRFDGQGFEQKITDLSKLTTTEKKKVDDVILILTKNAK
jgi:hypothetical protein